MFIQIETTPNPSTLKFIPGEEVLVGKTLQISDKEQAKASPLAERLFDIDGVRAVFLGHDFISVSKANSIAWPIIQPDILSTIMDHYMDGRPMLRDGNIPEKKKKAVLAENQDSPLVVQIKELIETRIRPAVAQDGGDIIFHGFENGVVKLELHGACSGCPSSTVTLKNGIENMLKYYVPEVESVEAVEPD
jgi:Fe-S cluster biogenesis protein NfuA